MTCRESRLNSALTTIARCMTGLADNQVLSLSHSIQDELPACTAAPSAQEWNLFIDATIAQYESGALRISPGSADPRRRLEAARSETPDAHRLYAARRILNRCERAVEAQRVFLEQYDRMMGLSSGSGLETFNTYFMQATADTTNAPTTDYERGFTANPDNSSLFTDRRSLYAYEIMQGNLVRSINSQPSTPTVTRIPVDSSAVSEIGYNRDTNRLEIVMRTSPDRVYAYRVPEGVYSDLLHSPSVGRFYARNIRGNPAYLYSTTSVADEDATRARCATCGQWADEGHACPVTGSEEEMNRDMRVAVARTRARTVATSSTDPFATAPVRIAAGLRTTRFLLAGGTLRMINCARLQQEARRSPTNSAIVPLQYSTSDGSTVYGCIQVNYNGRGRGYTVIPVAEPGDSGSDNLRCTCAEYRRRYRCQHTEELVPYVAVALNPTVNPVDVINANTTVLDAIAVEHAASETAIATMADEWKPVGTSFTDDLTIFQEMYDAAREARALHQDNPSTSPYPVPYLTENVFGGLGKRETGRGFGIEIEYSFPESIGWRERGQANARIGRELRDLRLTQTETMGYYGETHGWFRDQHEEGWAFEEDGSTVGGGEIISPVMYDDPETWENIQKVTNILERNGAIATTHTGLHVHVGIADYDHTVDNHNRLLTALAENEDLLYRLSANPETGRHRGLTYCTPNEQASSPYTSIDRASYNNAGHDLALNMESVHGANTDNVEYRTYDASLKPGVIQAQIGLSLYLTDGALRPGTVEAATLEPHPIGEQRAANQDSNGRVRPLTGDAWKESTKGFRKFIDKYIPGTTDDDRDNPQVKQMVSLFAMTRWQRRRW